MITTPNQLFEIFNKLNIEYKNYTHKAVFSAKEAEHTYDIVPGHHCKNLFLISGKKKDIYLISMSADKQADLKTLSNKLEVKRFSFGNAELLELTLGIKPGSVTPFALINDKEKKANVVLDAEMLKHEYVNFHPMINTASVVIKSSDLIKFIESLGYKPTIISIY